MKNGKSSKQNVTTTHSLNFQYSTTNDIPRYDRLTDRRNGHLRWAEWYYGPQKRLLGIYKFEKDFNGFFDKLTANLNYQHIEESRFQRPFQNVKRQSRIEALNIYGYNVDLVKHINYNHKFQVGTDGQLNFLNSISNLFPLKGSNSNIAGYPIKVGLKRFIGIHIFSVFPDLDKELL